MDVIKTIIIKVFMNGIRHRVTNAQHCPESIGTRAKMSNLTKEFQCMTFLLQRINFGICSTINFDSRRLYFYRLSLSLALN